MRWGAEEERGYVEPGVRSKVLVKERSDSTSARDEKVGVWRAGGWAWLMAGWRVREADNGGEPRRRVSSSCPWAGPGQHGWLRVRCPVTLYQQVLRRQWCPHILAPTQLSWQGQD